jgi:very-short-patch-repair endonuclease
MSGMASEQPWRRLMAECSATGGVFTASRAAALGIDKKRLHRLVTAGTLVREARGVYRLAGAPLGFADRVRIATERAGGVASHQTAGRLWGFEGCATTPIHVTVRHGTQRVPAESVVVHTTRRSVAVDTVVREGVPVTRPSRTALDLAGAQVGDRQLLDYLNHCVAQRLFTVAGLGRFLAGAGCVPGCVRLRTLLGSMSDIDSVAEARLVEVLVAAGVARPVTQFTIRDQGRFVARVDLAWPALRVALEVDGYRYHADIRSFVSDRERGNRIVACGWALLRTTPAAVRDNPHMVVSDVRAALERAA